MSLRGPVRLFGMGLGALLILSGCAPPGPTVRDDTGYGALAEAVRRSDCAAAERTTQTLARDHPEDSGLANAYLEAAYVCLRGGELDTAEGLAFIFLQRFSGHPSEDYGHYLYALAGYARWRSLPADTPLPEAAAEARKAFGRFRVLMDNHPSTAYAADVRPLLVDLREGLARVELAHIREDMSAGRHDAVLSRARYVLAHYSLTAAAPYALAALVQAHQARGESAEARRWRQQLESDWPDHPVLEGLGPAQQR